MQSNFQSIFASEANQEAAQALRVYSDRLKDQLGNPECLTTKEAISCALEYAAVQEQLSAIPVVKSSGKGAAL